MSCGDDHTVALSKDGELWTWGKGNALGLVTEKTSPVPHPVRFLQGRTVIAVSCGAKHTLALVKKLKPSNPSAGQSPNVNKLPRRSSSPVINGTQYHRARPATCVKCSEEVYTFSETADACIICNRHRCPKGSQTNICESPRSSARSRTLSQEESRADKNQDPIPEDKYTRKSSQGNIASNEKLPRKTQRAHSQGWTDSSTLSDNKLSQSLESGFPKVNNETRMNNDYSETRGKEGQEHGKKICHPCASSPDLTVRISPTDSERNQDQRSLPSTPGASGVQSTTVGSLPGSPLVKKVGNFFQYVSSSSQPVQEYMSSIRTSVVSNIRTSVNRIGSWKSSMEEEDDAELGDSSHAKQQDDFLSLGPLSLDDMQVYIYAYA